ncbi:MAG TPA: HAD family acid phosphatase [Candidatus Eisenbacteria bacterium]|nr:HAD family acid phosphatase [Candidatus Eisenbacteria bacterium]
MLRIDLYAEKALMLRLRKKLAARAPVWGYLLLWVVGGCATVPAAAPGSCPRAAAAADERLLATLWQQTSAEYRVLARSIYTHAKSQLEQALEDKQWTAEPSQKQRKDFAALPPAVILDIDETVLDTSSFQAHLIESCADFSEPLWQGWIRRQGFPPVPGAVDFVAFAQARGVTVFFVTGRDHAVEPETRANLRAAGIGLPERPDTVLTRGEMEDWGVDKTSRRRFIARGYRILLVIGDDLGDFISEYRDTPRRRIAAALKQEEWGTKWLVLPNAIYGSWVGSLYGFDSGAGKEEISRRKLEWLSATLR